MHLASCPACSAELTAYRDIRSSLAAYGDIEVDVPEGYLERTLALVPDPSRRSPDLREASERLLAMVRRRPAVASLTGAAVGAAAIGLIAWRRGRRALEDAARLPEVAPQQ
jgi:hypothetical protein